MIADFTATGADLDFTHDHVAIPAQALGFNLLAAREGDRLSPGRRNDYEQEEEQDWEKTLNAERQTSNPERCECDKTSNHRKCSGTSRKPAGAQRRKSNAEFEKQTPNAQRPTPNAQ